MPQARFCVCSLCNKEIRQFERKLEEEGLQLDLFPQDRKKRKKIIQKIKNEQVLIEDHYRDYTALFEVELKKVSLKLLNRTLFELQELQKKIQRREVLVTRIFYDCKKLKKEEAGYRVSSDFFRSKERIVNASRNSKEEMAVIEKIITVMGEIAKLYKKYKKEDRNRELLEMQRLIKF